MCNFPVLDDAKNDQEDVKYRSSNFHIITLEPIVAMNNVRSLNIDPATWMNDILIVVERKSEIKHLLSFLVIFLSGRKLSVFGSINYVAHFSFVEDFYTLK